jgi:ribonucleoside-triphosphate reductase (thioredoxin)
MVDNISTKILADVVTHTKYAKHLRDEKRRETWEEIVERNRTMHLNKYPHMKEVIDTTYDKFVLPKKILPSMRSMQFAGRAIERNPSRIYNCAYMPISHIDSFSELMFLLLGGVGVGYSVQYRHINKLPKVVGPRDMREPRRYVVGDSIEGWSDAVKVLMESYLLGKDAIRFDFNDIREKGTELVVSGGKAPGPDPLRICLTHVSAILKEAVGRRLQPIEAHDICCYIADGVLAGGIRRAALIALFSPDDIDMITCKSGLWYEANPQRGRANNSVSLHRGSTTKEEFFALWERIKNSGSGEPGIYWTNNLDWGTNPCCEIALRPYQFCNLTEVNVSDVDSQEELDARVWGAAVIGTLQAGYTDFHYLRPEWKKTTEAEALVGVGMTGIGSGTVLKLDLKKAAQIAVETNGKISRDLGIKSANRITTIKPSGTSSIVLGCSSGVHAWHSPYYIRRMRLGKDEGIYKYFNKHLPSLLEDDYYSPRKQAVLSIPQAAPEGSIFRTESAIELYERALQFNNNWVREGHVKGVNFNNVSCTISLKESDWEHIGVRLWNDRNLYNGMSVLPYDGGTYVQAPFEECTKEVYENMYAVLKDIDLSKVVEDNDTTDLRGELACAGGVCEVM